VISRAAALAAVVALLVAGCATFRPPLEQRSTHGPTARQFWMMQMAMANNREPNLDERRHWEDQLDYRIQQYLMKNPEQANALYLSTFRFDKQVVTGMEKEQVTMLLGAPLSTTTDQAEIEKLARKFWRQIQGNATEAWVYELGWRFYFAGTKLIDITQYLERD
jgi:hypothetical protein